MYVLCCTTIYITNRKVSTDNVRQRFNGNFGKTENVRRCTWSKTRFRDPKSSTAGNGAREQFDRAEIMTAATVEYPVRRFCSNRHGHSSNIPVPVNAKQPYGVRH